MSVLFLCGRTGLVHVSLAQEQLVGGGSEFTPKKE